MDYKLLPPNFVLDESLRAFIESAHLEPNTLKIALFHKNIKADDMAIKEIVRKLRKDGYIDQDSGPIHSISFEGRVFISNGGYTQMSADASSAREHTANIERGLRRVARWAAIGAVGILVLEIIKLIIQRLDMIFCNCN